VLYKFALRDATTAIANTMHYDVGCVFYYNVEGMLDGRWNTLSHHNGITHFPDIGGRSFSDDYVGKTGASSLCVG
jgi:hypothetical protein